MLNTFEQVLACLDSLDTTIDFATRESWHPADRDWLTERGILVETTATQRIACPACECEHVEDLVRVVHGDGVRCFVACPDRLRVLVNPDHLRRWQVDPNAFARMLCQELDCDCTKPREISADHAWQLGRIKVWEKLRPVVFAVGMQCDEGPRIASAIGRSGQGIVLVPWSAPDPSVWTGRVPAVVPIRAVADLREGHFELQLPVMVDIVLESDRTRDLQNSHSMSKADKDYVKKAVHKVIENMVSEDVLVQAYKAHGSYRKAADALVAEGQITDRWAVERAVKARGGPDAVKNKTDSASVNRRVASQSRDRGKKMLQYSK